MDAHENDILDLDEMERSLLLALAQLKQVTTRRKARLVFTPPAEVLPVDKPAPTPYVEFQKDFTVASGNAYISAEIAKELVDASRDLREWLSSPNPSMEGDTIRLIASTLEHRLNNAVRSMEAAIRRAEDAVHEFESDEE
jgi:hypothetical protein